MLRAKLYTRFADIAWEIAHPHGRAVFLIFLQNLRRFTMLIGPSKANCELWFRFLQDLCDLAILIGPDEALPKVCLTGTRQMWSCSFCSIMASTSLLDRASSALKSNNITICLQKSVFVEY